MAAKFADYPHYESEPLYIDALVNSIEKLKINWKPDLIVSSIMEFQNLFDKEILSLLLS